MNGHSCGDTTFVGLKTARCCVQFIIIENRPGINANLFTEAEEFTERGLWEGEKSYKKG